NQETEEGKATPKVFVAQGCSPAYRWYQRRRWGNVFDD
ncbi:unnamed protein product, partial [marine sediment metagenome]